VVAESVYLYDVLAVLMLLLVTLTLSAKLLHELPKQRCTMK
jgi:hypothetical protein